MGMKVGFLVLKLCIFTVVFSVHESTGYSISPSPEIFSMLSPSEESGPSIDYHGHSQRTSTPSPSPLPSGSVLRPPVVAHHQKSAPMPQNFQGFVPSIPPSSPMVVPSHKSAPNPSMPQVVQGIVPSMPPSPSMGMPSNKSALMPRVVQGIAPSMPPSPPVVMSSNKSAPSPRIVQGITPSMPPSLPVAVPSNKSAPTPKVVQGIVPSMPPSPLMGVPSNKSAPVPRIVQGTAPSMPPSLPVILPSNKSAPPPQVVQRIVPSMPPSSSVVVPSNKSAPTPRVVQGIVPSMPPSPPVVVPTNESAPTPRVVQSIVPSMPPSPPVVAPSHKSGPTPRAAKGIVPSKPPSDPPSHKRAPDGGIPIKMPLAPAPVESPPRRFPRKPPAMHPTMPKIAPSIVSDPAASPISAPLSSISRKRHGVPVAPPPMINNFPPMNHSPTKASPPHKAMRRSNDAPAPSNSPKPAEGNWVRSPASSPINSFYKYHHARKRASSLAPAPAPAPSFWFPPPMSNDQGSINPPATSYAPTVHPKKRRRRHHNPVPKNHAPSISPIESPFPSTVRHRSPMPSPTSPAPSGPSLRPIRPPKSSPSGSSPRKPMMPLTPPVRALPPPPPNQDCTSVTCTEPLTNSPPGSPCLCVWPMEVGLRLSVALYTFFPLVSELAVEIATGVFLKLSQVRIMGANADGQQLDKTIVLMNLVPLGERFDNTTAFLTYEKFWRKQVLIKASFFGDYEVLYVRYPGLPPSPPSAPSSINTLDSGHGSNGRTIQPLGVDVRRKRKGGLGGSMIAIIVLSSSIAVALCIIAAWLLLLKCGNHTQRIPAPNPPILIPSLAKTSGNAGSMMFGSGPSSASMSFGSSITTYTGSARTYGAGEIEKATDNFNDSRILGEGGFGRVYRGILDDGTQVAVKVLKRDDQQGGREFLAEVEMLSRLHHRNLVKLIGICIEENARCLVYELIANGSVESHLHGPDKETAPLDWGARIKIALGAARGLAYLHEDSSPHVIHRDFKSSNILLEHDFTAKVSDFGLARTALEEGNQHITTRVMGTFGYVAPEYAMTGHLLVKSDVYSYGVVLLELLTGRKPVDMSQPQGQENLVAWARPFLTSKEGLEMIIDPSLGSNVPFDSVAKVAAIASMCVQPEVSHRPFMGEVVQALKLVCNECDETKEAGGSESCGQEDLSIVDIDTRTSIDSGQLAESSRARYSMPEYNSSFETGRALSASDVFSMSSRIGRQESGSFRRYSSSGPLRTGRNRPFWQRIRSLSRGSTSEHGVAFRL